MEQVGYIILYHFDPPYQHARHCYDWAVDPDERIHDHYKRKSRGPALIHHALDAGVKLVVGRLWPGTKSDMLVKRNGGNASRLCKVCRQEKRMQWQDDHLEELLARSIERLNRSSNHK